MPDSVFHSTHPRAMIMPNIHTCACLNTLQVRQCALIQGHSGCLLLCPSTIVLTFALLLMLVLSCR